MKIKLLNKDLINKIAAGEVIENTISVVKEIIENSIDANARTIQIDLENAGKSKIEITDDGQGIEKEDLLNAVKKHATSKIDSDEDLYNIQTMGFRGEALYSISSVSKFAIISKPKSQKIGYGLFVDEILPDFVKQQTEDQKQETKATVDNKKVTIKPYPSNDGTKILIKDLFFNIPARRKFLEKSRDDLRKITETIKKYALIHPEIRFILTNTSSNRTTTLVDSLGDRREVISNIFKIPITEVYEFKEENPHNLEKIKIEGVITSPYKTFSSKKTYIFINKRPVDMKIVENAVYDAYKTFLFVNRNPFIFLDVEVDPHKIDVNIHPSKKEIKYLHDKELYNIVYESVRNTLYQKTRALENNDKEKQKSILDLEEKDSGSKTNLSKKEETSKNSLEENKNSSTSKAENFTFENSKDEVIESSNNIHINTNNQENNYINKNSKKTLEDDYFIKKDENPAKSLKETHDPIYNENKRNFQQTKLKNLEEEEQISRIHDKELNSVQILGQINKTYIIIEYNSKMFIVDQHAMDERINYEKNMNLFMTNSIKTQMLITPEQLPVDPEYYILFKENQDYLSKFGFDVDDFGDNTLLIRSIPIVLEKHAGKELLFELLDSLKDKSKQNNLEKIAHESIITMSCKESIKANAIYSNEFLKRKFLKLMTMKNPFQCPHGRPTMIEYSYGDLEKMFKRK